MIEYETREKSLVVLPKGADMLLEYATVIEITDVDEPGNEYAVLRQDSGKIFITPDEWPALRKAMDRIIRHCRRQPEDAATPCERSS